MTMTKISQRTLKGGLLAAIVLGALPQSLSAFGVDGQIIDRGRFPRTIYIIKPVGASDVGTILLTGDDSGNVRLSGLQPGGYTVEAHGDKQQARMKVEADGRLSFAVYRDDGPKKADAAGMARQKPVNGLVRRWAEQIPFSDASGKLPDNSVVHDMRKSFSISPPTPCAPPRPGIASTCPGRLRNFIDINASPAEEISRLAPTVNTQTAALIVAERAKGGAFRNAQDFANRVCTKVAVDFDEATLKLGNTAIVMKRGGDPKAAGFKCNPRPGAVDIFANSIATRNMQFGFRFQF
jgi:hypothetical protein